MTNYERGRGGSNREDTRNQWRDEDRFGGYGRDRDRDENRGEWRRGYGAEGPTQDWNRNTAYGSRDAQGSDWNWNRRGNDHFGSDRSGQDRNRDFAGNYGDSGYVESGSRGSFANDDHSHAGGRGVYGEGYGGRYGSPGNREGGRGRDFWDRASDEVSSWFGDDSAERRREQDARQGDQGAQHHVGRGPKGYTRSDERIREDVSDKLSDDPYIDASDLEVAVSNREVTLSGAVDSRQAKRRAEDIAERVSAVSHVSNNLRVRDRNAAATTGTSSTGLGSAGSGVI